MPIKKTEDRIQQEAVIWFRGTFPHLRNMLYSIPNGGYRNAREAKKMKDTGLTPGVADLHLLYKGKLYLPECKTPVGSQSKSQIAWEKQVKEHGFDYFLFRSWQEFRDIVLERIIDKDEPRNEKFNIEKLF